MKQIFTLSITILFCLFYKPSQAQTTITPFATPCLTKTSGQVSPLPSSTPAKLIDFKGRVNSDKVFLQWIVKENETADQFEVERSADGKNFTIAALVFGTDKPATDNYEFFEKAISQKTMYRIKLINKDKKTEYSPVIEIEPVSVSPEK